MEEKSKIAELRGLIEESKSRIANLSSEMYAEKEALSRLYVELFYAENGMEVGQHFMFNGVKYVRVVPVLEMGEVFFRAYRSWWDDVSSVWERANIYSSDYGSIKPIPMEKQACLNVLIR